MQSLTRSGAGTLIEPERLNDPDGFRRLRDLLAAQRFVVVRGALPNLAAAVELLSRFGPINQAPTRQDGAVVVEDQQEGEVFRSQHALPLHKDGVLTGFDVVVVGIYCIDFREVEHGRTFVSDAARALDTMPADHLALLRTHGMEAMAIDATGYYRSEFVGRWQPFPAMRAKPDGRLTPNLGLPHAPGEPASWQVRVAAVEAPVSDAILASLRRALLDERFVYYHTWREGDLLLMDNYEVMHGREAFRGRRRRLANIQVLAG